MIDTQVRPRRGRPPLEWLTERQLRGLPVGTVVLIDQGYNEHRVVGRITDVSPETIEVRRRDRSLVALPLVRVMRARVLDSVFEPGDPVLLAGVSDKAWRGGVVSTNGIMVRVETADGFELHDELELDHADDRAYQAEVSERMAQPRLKPGPVADDPLAERLNQEAFAQRAAVIAREESEWAL